MELENQEKQVDLKNDQMKEEVKFSDKHHLTSETKKISTKLPLTYTVDHNKRVGEIPPVCPVGLFSSVSV